MYILRNTSYVWVSYFTCRVTKGLVTNYGEAGGGYKTGRGHVKFYPYQRGEGGANKLLAMLRGGGHTSFEKVFTLYKGGGGTKGNLS